MGKSKNEGRTRSSHTPFIGAVPRPTCWIAIPVFILIFLTGFVSEGRSSAEKPSAEKTGLGKTMKGDPAFRFPKVDPAHNHMRLLLENAFRYVDPDHRLIDPVSGYPVEGWNEDSRKGLHLRSFTQLTAIGQWIELLANVVAGYAENPYLSREAAMKGLSRVVRSLRADQRNPSLAAEGLLVNFLNLEGGTRTGPLKEAVEREAFIDVFGENTGGAVWDALEEKGWILPEDNGRKGRIIRSEKYGAEHFDGTLAPFAYGPLKSGIMRLLDQRVVQIVFGDNANLTASLAKSVGALLRPGIGDDPKVSRLRVEMEAFINAQQAGYTRLFDPETGTLFFGWDATTDRMIGWDDGQGNWVRGRMNYFINEFRGPWIFTVLRYGLPEESIRNAGFKIKPYECADGRIIHALAAWEGSAFQLLGLSLFMQEHLNPGWAKSLENLVQVELDYSLDKGLPGFLSEAYSGKGNQYTGLIGISGISVTGKPLITHAPSLYTLGVAYMIAPDKVERFLKDRWQMISGLFSDHGPWEGYDTSTGEVIRYQTTVHTLSLILGGIGTAQENMDRYLKLKGLSPALETLYKPGKDLNLRSAGNRLFPWAVNHETIRFNRDNGECRFTSILVGTGGLTFTFPEKRGVSLSNGRLRIRYRSEERVEDAHVTLKRTEKDPFPEPAIPIEIFTLFQDTRGGEEEMEIVLPATPALRGIKDVSLVFGADGKRTSVDLSLTGFEFIPFRFAPANR